jgi:hypothetical protein
MRMALRLVAPGHSLFKFAAKDDVITSKSLGMSRFAVPSLFSFRRCFLTDVRGLRRKRKLPAYMELQSSPLLEQPAANLGNLSHAVPSMTRCNAVHPRTEVNVHSDLMLSHVATMRLAPLGTTPFLTTMQYHSRGTENRRYYVAAINMAWIAAS